MMLPGRHNAARNVDGLSLSYQNQIAGSDDWIGHAFQQIGNLYYLKRYGSAIDRQGLGFLSGLRAQYRLCVKYLNRAGCSFAETSRCCNQLI